MYYQYIGVLLLLSTDYSISPAEAADGIGLVYLRDKMEVSSTKTEFPLVLVAQIFSDVTFQKGLVTEIMTSVNTILTIPGIKNQPTVFEAINLQVQQIKVIFDEVTVKLSTLYSYKSVKAFVEPTVLCATKVSSNIDVTLFAAKTFITNSITTLGLDYTTEQIKAGTREYNDIVNVVQDAYLQALAVENKILHYLATLEALTAGTVPSEISALIQDSPCTSAAQLDKIKLKMCEKTLEGLVCYMDVEVYTSTKSYLRYIPVNYHGVHLDLPKNTILAKTDEKHGLLRCRDEPEEMVNDCSFESWNFTDDIFGPNPAEAISKLNFTIAEPPLPFQTHDTSVLIMDKRFAIQSKVGENAEKTITNKSPMAVRFDKNTEISTKRDEVQINFKGGILAAGIETSVSVFNDSMIQLMHANALHHAFWSLDWLNILKYFGLVVQIIVLPVAFSTCSLSVYALIRSILSRRKKQKKEKIEKKYALRRNYEMNKRTIKKLRK